MAVVRGSEVLEGSQARVYAGDGRVIGAGFLVAGDVLCTCAHVVARALGLPGTGPDEPPDRAVEVDFPLVTGRPRARARVESWRANGVDVALLRLDGPVGGTRPAPLVDGTDVWEHPFRTMGFPADAGHGVWAHGTLRAGLGSGWVQMETAEPGPRIVKGFSGAPVWDGAQNGVVGMTVAAHVEERTAYLLPSADLVDEATLVPRCPFRGLTAFTEDDAEFFHGREAETERLLAAVRGRSLTLVAGPSGCGKSSLVSAGVLPRLRAAGAGVTELRPVPGVRPAAVVARALAGVLEPELGEVERLAAAEELAGLLEANGDFAAELRARVTARGTGGHVLFVDQLEEYVSAGPEAGRALLGLLNGLAGEGLRVVATARPGSLDALITADTSDLVSEAVRFLAPLTPEDLGRAVTAPVDAVPGLWFEAGLPERIVADAGDEPGRMPLVQFALTELWRRRSRAMLTHAAYDALGGVAGALVGSADDAHEKLPESERGLARRLFVQLARPGDGDTFTRRPTRTTDLAPELVALARKLAPDKLVVLSHAPGGDGHEEIVDLAHEALTVHWPLLRGWLTESRDFRRWQEQVRADLDRWRSQQREPARLLGGTDLAEAERRLAEHPEPDDIPAAEREYVRLSRRHAQRGTRLRQAAFAGLAALTALAVVLVFTTYRSLRETERQLRTQAAGLLARTAEERPPNDPGTALQLALAAWHAADTPQSRQALMNQYVRGQYVTGSQPSLWSGRIDSLTASDDGRVLVVESEVSGDQSALTVVTGAPGGKRRAQELGGVPAGSLRVATSPDGRFVAAAVPTGDVRLWRTEGDDAKRPAVLTSGPYELRGGMDTRLDFSSDSRRLLLGIIPAEGCVTAGNRCSKALVDVWGTDLDDGSGTTHRIALEKSLGDVAFTSDADSVAVVPAFGEGEGTVDVRDLSSGRLLYSRSVTASGFARFREGGNLVAPEKGEPGKALELGRMPGRTYEAPSSFQYDATERYTYDMVTVEPGTGAELEYVELLLLDVRGGRTYYTRLPSAGFGNWPEIAVVPGEGEGPTVLAVLGSTLLEARAEPVGGERFRPGRLDESVETLSPDGRLLARVASGRIHVLDTSRRKRMRSFRLPRPVRSEDWTAVWTADSRRLVVWGKSGRLLRSYPVDGTGSRSTPLNDALPDFDRVKAVVGVGGSEIAVVSTDARLARVDTATGKVTTRPFSIHRDTRDGDSGDVHFGDIQLAARPKHPGQVATATFGSTIGRNAVLLWDLRGSRLVTAPLRGMPVTTAPPGARYPASFAFDPAGTHLAVVNTDTRARVWDVSSAKPVAPPVSWKTEDQLAGLTADGRVVAFRDKRLHFIDPEESGNNMSMPVPPGLLHLDGHRLTVESKGVKQSFDLRPEAQFRALCDAAGRDYTAAERELLPEGTPDEPPCS
ncbi:AAA family ATPase [Streptomyces sp. ML-6]|uniref:nSTAND1 domain-containing NTPase n=1 Tax=Streptomyces sp. ML-6 TaxID=2982693 RepID=UPI0024C0A391|nr:AAA family ATPase [Streptomyces sp. ML-6]MDK0519349.1 AAA family ATPase [Streptomyces sp. ML-6]